MLRALGLPAGQCRLPLGPSPGWPGGPGPCTCSPGSVPGRATLADPVRLVFLGGLGEIGRNCACIEVDGRILLLDCGLMFPDLEMPGVDLVLPDFTYLRDNASGSRRASSPTATRTTSAASASCSRELSAPVYGSALTLGLARNRIEEAGLLGRDRPSSRSATANGARSGPSTWSSSRSPTRCPTASPPPSTPPRASSCTPGTSSSTSRRSTAAAPTSPASAPSPRSDGIRLLLADSTNAEEPGHTESERTVGAVAAGPLLRPTPTSGSSSPASPATSTASSRSPTPPSPSGRTIATLGPLDGQERRPRPLARPPARPDDQHWSTSRRSTTSIPGGSASSRPAPRASRCRRWPSWPRGRTGGSRSRGRPRHPLVARHPRQRVQRRQGDRRPARLGARSSTRAWPTST